MTNLDEGRQVEMILMPLVKQRQGGVNNNQLAAMLSPGDEPSCQSNIDGGNMIN